jgi:hypothetical protein
MPGKDLPQHMLIVSPLIEASDFTAAAARSVRHKVLYAQWESPAILLATSRQAMHVLV